MLDLMTYFYLHSYRSNTSHEFPAWDNKIVSRLTELPYSYVGCALNYSMGSMVPPGVA